MDEQMRAVLDRRTARYAVAPAGPPPAEVGRFVGCRVGDTVVGIPVALVHELAPLRHWTPLKGPRSVLGVTHVRGDVMALVDVFGELTGRPTEVSGRSEASGAGAWIAVLEGRGGRAAAPVSEVLGARTVSMPELIPAAQAPLLGTGVAAVTTDLWFLLEADAVAAALEPLPTASA